MSEPTPLWPSLGFERIGALDYGVMQFEAEWLNSVAARLQDDSGQSGVCPTLGPLRWSVGECLRRLADTPAALKQLNHHLDRAPQSVRGLNKALHYLAIYEHNRNSANARAAVAHAWGGKEKSVKDLRRKYGKAAGMELERIVTLVTSRPHQQWTRDRVLRALDSDLVARAKLPWFAARKRSTKPTLRLVRR